MKKPYEETGDFQLTMFSLVDRCPYCGNRFDEKGQRRDGSVCTHPTAVRDDKGQLTGFMAAGGRRR